MPGLDPGIHPVERPQAEMLRGLPGKPGNDDLKMASRVVEKDAITSVPLTALAIASQLLELAG